MMGDRSHRGLLWVSAVAASWLGMMAVHELGHVLAAWALVGLGLWMGG